MTRGEQIKQQADIYIGHPQDLGEDISTTNMRNAFIEGAKWADEHLNPNTIKKIFKFALEKTNFLLADNLESIDWGVLIKKAMEE